MDKGMANVYRGKKCHEKLAFPCQILQKFMAAYSNTAVLYGSGEAFLQCNKVSSIKNALFLFRMSIGPD
jgi:hypothetical protein